MRLELEVQNASSCADVPSQEVLERWAGAAFRERKSRAELVIRIVDEAEGAALNRQYRHKEGATNVLSFPFEPPPGVSTRIVGDLVLCAPLVIREAAEQGKTAQAHWAHLVVHGVLHLLGHDHRNDEEAAEMEGLEIEILTELGFADPYLDH